MSLKDFQTLQRLGSGSFSTVYKVKRISDGQIYALKQVKMGMLSAKEKENALNEIRILASVNSPHIVQFKDCFLDEKTNYLCIVLEFCEGGDIANQIKDHLKKRTYFKEETIWEYLIQLLKGLNALHQLTILHRDIKCANIFLSKDKCKLGDLNVSKVSKNNLVQTQTGTPYYTAPEIWRDQKYDGRCDIWSLGCVIYEIAALQPPFRAQGIKELNSKVQSGRYSHIPKIYSSDLSDIISQCLKVRPQLRPTAEQLLNNPIIQQHDKKGQILQGQNVRLSKEQLLATIKLPRNLGALKEKLPKPKYQEKLNSSFEKKVGLEVIMEADSLKMPDCVYKSRINSARAKRKIDIYQDVQKEQLKQQKLQIEKEQEELKKRLQMQAERKKRINDLQRFNQPSQLRKIEEKKPVQNQKYQQVINKPPVQNRYDKPPVQIQYKYNEKNQPIQKNQTPIIKENKYLKPQSNEKKPVLVNQMNNQNKNQGIKAQQQNIKSPQYQQDKINFSRPQSEKRNIQLSKIQQIQQEIQKANQMKKPSINQKPRIQSAKNQQQRINYNQNKENLDINNQKKCELKAWQKQLGQKQLIGQNAMKLKKY